MELVVKRMSPQGQGDKGRRENKIHTFKITRSADLGLGLNLKEIKSGLGNGSSSRFLYVQELLEYANGDPGPGLVGGIRQYDLILKIHGVAIHTIADVRRAVEGQETVECEVRRMIRQFHADHPSHPNKHAEAKQETVIVTRAAGESLGLGLSEAYGGESGDPFLVVTKVRPGSAGERAGIRVRDICWQVDEKDVIHLDEFKGAVSGLEKFQISLRRQS
jgi:S1-C subfamily serine protease